MDSAKALPDPKLDAAPSTTDPAQFRAAYDSPLGTLHLRFEGAVLTALDLPSSQEIDRTLPQRDRSHPAVECVAAQLDEYFAGRRTEFTFALRFRGTPFEERVWTALAKVPHGTTVSYAELARAAGAPGAARAVGGAVGRNPLPICVPCHRVVAADGSLGGFSGGLAAKRRLHDVERITLARAVRTAKRQRAARKADPLGA